MRRLDLVLKSIFYHARAHVALSLACATACAVVTGALLVGDSVRGSLRDRARERLGEVEWSLVAGRFFREELAVDLAEKLSGDFVPPVPLILLRGTLVHERGEGANGLTTKLVAQVNVIAVDERFALVAEVDPNASGAPWGPLAVGRRGGLVPSAVNQQVALEISAQRGDKVQLHFEKAEEVAREFALGRRRDTVQRLGLEVAMVLPDEGGALFDLRHQQATPLNVFVPLGQVQRQLKQNGRVNALLLARTPGAANDMSPQKALAHAWQLEDLGLRVRQNDELGHLALESREFLLSGEVVAAARRAAHELNAPYLEVLTYLANTIGVGEREIPYSTVAAVGFWTEPDGKRGPPLGGIEWWETGAVALNSWAAKDLQAKAGDQIYLDYYDVRADHELVEKRQVWPLRAVVPLEGETRDPRWTPDYPGVTDAATFGSWDGPFELDHDRIRDPGPDGDYWKEYGTTPKVFLPLADGKRLWASRFGELTSLRLRRGKAADGRELSLKETADAFATRLMDHLAPEEFGLAFRPIRLQAMEAARTGTDFAGLFLALSFFIILSALILVAVTFRLALERRAREFGMLCALGFDRRSLRSLLFAEGLGTGVIGTLAGLAGGIGYAALLIAALKSEAWWGDAVNAPFLSLHVTETSALIGGLSTVFLAAVVILLVAHRLAALPPRRLLSGKSLAEMRAERGGGARWSLAAGIACLVLAALFLALAEGGSVDRVVAFFVLGPSVLLGGLALFWWNLRRPRASAVGRSGLVALARLGAQNGRRAAGRSLLTAGLIASATFVIVVVAANRQDPSGEMPEKDSGNGGFAGMAFSALPLFQPLDTEEGREELNLADATRELLTGPSRVRVHPLRLRPGDETSCLNLYKPKEPRVLGASAEFLRRGGFRWAASLARTQAERENPWLLLERDWARESEGSHEIVVPAVGDENSVKWILQLGLGGDIELTDDLGQRIKLRFVGILARSIFQGDVIISERDFLRHFPSHPGWSAFLVEPPRGDVDQWEAGGAGGAPGYEKAKRLMAGLEGDLAEYGLDARTTGDMLKGYLAVQNTYLSTFFVLGGLGLLLGTLGLGAVLLRNVLERRGELALLRALGYSSGALGWLVFSETAWLLVLGVVLGGGSAFLAVLPNLAAAGSEISWPGVLGTLGLVLVAGIASCALALISALRTPLLATLRAE